MTNVRTSPSGPLVAVGGSVPPLSTVLFVDPGSSGEPGDATGSIAAPFLTLQAAVDAAPAACTIVVVPNEGGAPMNAAWTGKTLTFTGWGFPSRFASAAGGMPNVGTLDLTGDSSSFLYLQNVRAGLVRILDDEEAAVGTIVAEGTVFSGGVACDTLECSGCHIGNPTIGTSGVSLTDCTFAAGAEIAGPTSLDAVSYARAVTATVTFDDPFTLIEGSDGIRNQSGVAGTTVSDALDTLAP